MRAIGALCGLLCGCNDPTAPTTAPLEPISFQQLALGGATRASGHRIAFDRGGNVVVTLENTGTCAEIVKVSGEGAPLWRKTYTPAGPELGCTGHPLGLAIDPDENILAIGTASKLANPATNSVISLRKYGPQGDVIWDRQHDSGAGGLNLGEAVATDRAGNICAAGAVSGGAPRNPWLARYAPDGTQLWRQEADGNVHGWTDVGVDGGGAVLVAASAIERGVYVRKVDSGGTLAWEQVMPEGVFEDFAAHGDGSSVIVRRSDFRDPDRTRLTKLDAEGATVFEVTSSRVFTLGEDLVTPTFSRVAVAADGTIHMVSDVFIDQCSEPPCVFERGVLLTSYTPEGVPVSWRLFEPSEVGDIHTEAIAIGDRGQIAFTGEARFHGQSEPSGFVVIAGPD